MSASLTKLRIYRTRIGGRRLIFRLGRLVIDVAATWGVPWGEYVAPVFIKIHRMAFGFRFAVRLWKPYIKVDVQMLPSRLFETTQ